MLCCMVKEKAKRFCILFVWIKLDCDVLFHAAMYVCVCVRERDGEQKGG